MMVRFSTESTLINNREKDRFSEYLDFGLTFSFI